MEPIEIKERKLLRSRKGTYRNQGKEPIEVMEKKPIEVKEWNLLRSSLDMESIEVKEWNLLRSRDGTY